MKHKLAFWALLALITFASCGKENGSTEAADGDNPAAAPSKKLKKVSLIIPGGAEISYNYVWEGDKLKSVAIINVNDIVDESYTFTYSGDKLSKAIYRNESEEITNECDYSWNGNKIDTEKYTHSNEYESNVLTYKYSYSGSKPTRLAIYGEDDEIEPDYLNIVWTGNNVTQHYYDDGNIVTLTYDNKKNPLYLPQMGYIPSFFSIGHYDLCWSENNITRFEVSDTKGDDTGDGVGNFTYTYDDDGYPATMTYSIDGMTITCVYTYYE